MGHLQRIVEEANLINTEILALKGAMKDKASLKEVLTFGEQKLLIGGILKAEDGVYILC